MMHIRLIFFSVLRIIIYYLDDVDRSPLSPKKTSVNRGERLKEAE